MDTAKVSPPTARLGPLAALAPFVRPHLRRILLALLALLVAAGASLVLPIAAREVIDHGFRGGGAQHVGRYFLGLLTVTAYLIWRKS